MRLVTGAYTTNTFVYILNKDTNASNHLGWVKKTAFKMAVNPQLLKPCHTLDLFCEQIHLTDTHTHTHTHTRQGTCP